MMEGSRGSIKKVLALVVTAGLIGGAIFLSNRRREGRGENPESALWQMLDQSRAGNVDGYLACFTGSTRAQLEATVRSMTPSLFAEYLRESTSKIKGVAVFDAQRPAEGLATLTVEYVYSDRNERQRMKLRLEHGVWKIESTDASRRIQPVIPYGKPVTDGP